MTRADLPYLQGYPAEVQIKVAALLSSGQLGPWLQQRYPESHQVQTDKALYGFVEAMRQDHLRNTSPLSRVCYDSKLDPVQQALGTNAFVSRVQGGKLKAKNEIRIASAFREAPEAFLRMIVAHELAHLREKDHNKAFYKLCCHMVPEYPQLEFDTRLWLTLRQAAGASG